MCLGVQLGQSAIASAADITALEWFTNASCYRISSRFRQLATSPRTGTSLKDASFVPNFPRHETDSIRRLHLQLIAACEHLLLYSNVYQPHACIMLIPSGLRNQTVGSAIQHAT